MQRDRDDVPQLPLLDSTEVFVASADRRILRSKAVVKACYAYSTMVAFVDFKQDNCIGLAT